MFEFYTIRGEQKIGSGANITPVGSILLSPKPMIGASGSVAEAFSATSDYLFCNGAAVSRTTYSALFTTIGIAYGSGDGISTFNLPDFRQLFLRGSASLNVPGGSASHSHTVAAHSHNLPKHRHTMPADLISNHNHTAGTGYEHEHEIANHVHSGGPAQWPGDNGTLSLANSGGGSVSASHTAPFGSDAQQVHDHEDFLGWSGTQNLATLETVVGSFIDEAGASGAGAEPVTNYRPNTPAVPGDSFASTGNELVSVTLNSVSNYPSYLTVNFMIRANN